MTDARGAPMSKPMSRERRKELEEVLNHRFLSWVESHEALASDALREEKLAEIRQWHGPTDSCDAEGGECSLCGILDCPLADPLHYHHDGCPSEYVQEKQP
jgi:hypothetical protein